MRKVNEAERDSWDDYFMGFALHAASRATCLRRQVGAVLIKNRGVLATGYNGAPRGTAHASEVGCLRQRLGIPSGERVEICRGAHAEANAIAQAARHGVSVEGAACYCTHRPCASCTKLLINAGVMTVYYIHPYADPLADELSREAGLNVKQM